MKKLNLSTVVFVGFAVICLSGCATVPPLLDEDDLPVTNIINDAVCQTRQALKSVQDAGVPSKNFDPKNWAVGITLSPKSSLQWDVGVSGTGKSNPAGQKGLFSVVGSLASIGGAPAADYNSNAFTQGIASYLIHSSSFFSSSDTEIAALCTSASTSFHRYDITRDMQLDKWLQRVIGPVNGTIISLGGNSPSSTSFSYQVDLVIYEGAGATVSYAVPSGRWTAGPGAGVKRTQEVSLTISFSADSGMQKTVRSAKGKIVKTFKVPSAEAARAIQLQQLLNPLLRFPPSQ